MDLVPWPLDQAVFEDAPHAEAMLAVTAITAFHSVASRLVGDNHYDRQSYQKQSDDVIIQVAPIRTWLPIRISGL